MSDFDSIRYRNYVTNSSVDAGSAWPKMFPVGRWLSGSGRTERKFRKVIERDIPAYTANMIRTGWTVLCTDIRPQYAEVVYVKMNDDNGVDQMESKEWYA